MRTDIPAPIQDTSHDLAPDALVTLYKIALKNLTTFFLSPKTEVIWQGDTYDDIPCHMTELEQEADGKRGRPKFTFVNPGGLFTANIYNGDLDNAAVTRIRILKADLDADLDFALTEKLRVSKVLTMNKDLVTVELRDILDGHQFILPARAYYPPEFGHVRLQ
jgi:phage-related protein